MEITFSDADLERMPNPLKANLLAYVFEGLASAQRLETETGNLTFNGFAYARLRLDGGGDDKPVVVLNDDQARELFAAIDIKAKKNDGDFVKEARAYSDTLKLLKLLATLEDVTPALLADHLGFDDARQIGPLLNSINKSLKKLTRNSEAALFIRNPNSGGYALHPITRNALKRAHEPFVREVLSALQAQGEGESGD